MCEMQFLDLPTVIGCEWRSWERSENIVHGNSLICVGACSGVMYVTYYDDMYVACREVIYVTYNDVMYVVCSGVMYVTCSGVLHVTVVESCMSPLMMLCIWPVVDSVTYMVYARVVVMYGLGHITAWHHAEIASIQFYKIVCGRPLGVWASVPVDTVSRWRRRALLNWPKLIEPKRLLGLSPVVESCWFSQSQWSSVAGTVEDASQQKWQTHLSCAGIALTPS